MSVKYIPVQWNPNKWFYDGIMLVGVFVFLWVFLEIAPGVLSHERPINPQIHNARAFGACAFVMLTIILCIGPLARLDRRFLPLLYNRRHFGVMTAAVALTHANYVLGWYFAFSHIPPLEGLLSANQSYFQVAGFPFELLGLFSLICLLLLAVTSHDFWLKFLTAPVWKRIHFLIYPAYAALVGHVALGILQDQQTHMVSALFIGGPVLVCVLHLLAVVHGRVKADRIAKGHGWLAVANVAEMQEGRAKIARLPDGNRVAVFLHEGKLSAISNACAHQNGPLGEGRIVDCLVTCPWHGFQYDVRTGQSPAPFTERVPTFAVRLNGKIIEVDPTPNPPGTPVKPVPLPEAAP